MASVDPKLGQKDDWRHDEIAVDATKPTLYQCDASYYSQIVRLALQEKHVEWKSRHITLVEQKENVRTCNTPCRTGEPFFPSPALRGRYISVLYSFAAVPVMRPIPPRRESPAGRITACCARWDIHCLSRLSLCSGKGW